MRNFICKTKYGRDACRRMLAAVLLFLIFAGGLMTVSEVNADEKVRTGSITVQTVSEDGRLIAGVRMGLYDEENNRIAQAVSTADGELVFEGVPAGKYTISQENTEDDFTKMGFRAVVSTYEVELPVTGEDGHVYYDLVCKPKLEILEESPETVTVRVLKLWYDNSDSEKLRPAEIEVGLYAGTESEPKETVTLNAGVNWQYCWENLDGSTEWSVREIEVPAHYKASIVREDSTSEISFMIRNVYSGDETEEEKPGKKTSKTPTPTVTPESDKPTGSRKTTNPPSSKSTVSRVKTGDESRTLYYMALLITALAVVLLAAEPRLRRRNRK